ETMRSLVLALEIVRMFREGATVRGFSVEALQRRSFIAAKLARGFAEGNQTDDAFLAGMLHGIGQLVIAERIPGRYAEVLARRGQARMLPGSAALVPRGAPAGGPRLPPRVGGPPAAGGGRPPVPRGPGGSRRPPPRHRRRRIPRQHPRRSP